MFRDWAQSRAGRGSGDAAPIIVIGTSSYNHRLPSVSGQPTRVNGSEPVEFAAPAQVFRVISCHVSSLKGGRVT